MRPVHLVVCVALLAGVAQAGTEHPPRAPEHPVTDDYFGTKVADPYRWMENANDPVLHKWVDAENRFTRTYMARIPIRRWIAGRLKQLWNFPSETAPEQVLGPRLFFRRNTGLQNQSVLYVQDSPSAKPRLLIDPNVISPDGSVALSWYWPSPDGKLLAYGLSPGGSDWITVHVLDVSTGKPLADVVRWLNEPALSWTNDDKGFFYSRYPRPPQGNEFSHEKKNEKVFYHAIGAPQAADRLIYARPDLSEWFLESSVSENGRYLLVTVTHGAAPANELYFADMGNPLKPEIGAPLKPLYVKNDASYEAIDVRDGELYLITNRGAPRQRLVAASLSDPDPGHWRTVVPEGKGVLGLAGFAGHYLAVNTLIDARSRLDLYDTNGRRIAPIALPGLGSIIGIDGLQGSDSLYFDFTSYLTPTSAYRFDVRTGKTETVFKPDLKFDASKYQTREVLYPSKDGTMVPMFILAAKTTKLDGRNPTMLYGYGGFGATLMPIFKVIYPVWLELGGVFAIAHTRGGGFYGEKWHQAGMLDKKQNVFDDFAWAAKYLIAKGYTSPKQLAIEGKSNGGLLIGATITQHPELFGAANVDRGVLDMLRNERFSTGAAIIPEFGSSADPRAFKWLYAYSPLHNVRNGTCYPPTLITTAWDDDRVVPMNSFKFAAALQRAQSCDNPILLRTNGATSHNYLPTDQDIAQTADIWSFEAYNLGMTAASIPQRH